MRMRTTEAGRVAGGEQVLWSRRAGVAATTHLLPHRQIHRHRMIRGLGVTIAAAGRRSDRSKHRFDAIYQEHFLLL